MRARSILLVLLAGCATAPAAPPPPAATAKAPPPAQPWRSTPPPGPIAVTQTPEPAAREQLLPNGLRVVVVERHERPTVILRLIFPQGTVSDPPDSAGATNLAVRLATDYYEVSSSGEPLYEEKSWRGQIVEAGGMPFSDVEPDGCVIGVSGLAVNTHKYLQKLAQAMEHPRHGEQSFAGRRDMLLDAIEDMESADPGAFVKVVTATAFGRGHPYARSVIGTDQSLENIGLEMVITRQRQVLVPGGATLLVVGDVQPDKLLAEVGALFRNWRGRAMPQFPIRPAPPVRHAGVGLLTRTPAQTLEVCAARPIHANREGLATLDVLAAVLGRGLGSRLNLSLREQHMLTYGTSADLVRRKYASAFLACATLDATRAEEGMKLFRETLASMQTTPPTAEELERAKALLHADVAGHRDDVFQIAGAWEEAVLTGDGRPDFAARAAAIEAVTGEQVVAMARKELGSETLSWTMSGEPAVASKAAAASNLGRSRPVVLER